MLVLIAQALGRDAETGEKDENRGENKGKPTTLSPFKAILQKERHHRTNRSFRQILFLLPWINLRPLNAPNFPPYRPLSSHYWWALIHLRMLQAKAPQRPAVVPWTFLDALDTSPTPACTLSPLPFHYNQMMKKPSPFLVPAEESRQKQLAAGVATRSYADCLKGPSATGDREEFVKLPSTQIDS